VCVYDFEAWASVRCKKSEMLDCVFELGNDNLQLVGLGLAVSAMLLMLGFLMVFLKLTMQVLGFRAWFFLNKLDQLFSS